MSLPLIISFQNRKSTFKSRRPMKQRHNIQNLQFLHFKITSNFNHSILTNTKLWNLLVPLSVNYIKNGLTRNSWKSLAKESCYSHLRQLRHIFITMFGFIFSLNFKRRIYLGRALKTYLTNTPLDRERYQR
jgi:hypothetical protein